MAAYGDSKPHTVEVSVGEIGKGSFRRSDDIEKRGALTAVHEGLDGGAPKPPDPRASMREEGTSRIDPTAIRVDIDFRRRFLSTARRYSCIWDASFNMSQVRKGMTGSCHTEPVDPDASALLPEARLEISGLGRGPKRDRLTR